MTNSEKRILAEEQDRIDKIIKNELEITKRREEMDILENGRVNNS